MLSRALSLATVTLLLGWFAATPVRAPTQNLEAGKSPSQIFAGTCNACHKSPRGLLKTVSPGSLPGFLREHYTTSSDMASLLSAFLISNGATDTRYGRSQSNPATDAKSGGGPEADRQGRRTRAGSQEAVKPDADGISQPGEPGRQGRKRAARPGEGPDETKPAMDGQAPVEAGDAIKLTAKQRLSKRGRPGGEETPKTDAAKSDAAKSDAAKSDAAKSDTAKPETAKSDAGKDDSPKAESKSEPAREDSGKPEGTKPAGEGEAAKIEGSKDNGSGTPTVLRADPVPPVTPAPQAPAASSAAASSGAPEQAAAPRPSATATSEPPRSAVTASAPPPTPAAASGPPVPPISQ